MGGGSQKSSNQTSDNDIMASDNATVLGENSSYSSTELGMGSSYVGDGSTKIEDNSGLIIGDSADINTGIQLGVGSSYIDNSMDESTSELLNNAMTLMYANTENVLNAHAEDSESLTSALGSLPASLNLDSSQQETGKETGSSIPDSTKWKVGAGVTGLILLAMYMKEKSKNDK